MLARKLCSPSPMATRTNEKNATENSNKAPRQTRRRPIGMRQRGRARRAKTNLFDGMRHKYCFKTGTGTPYWHAPEESRTNQV